MPDFRKLNVWREAMEFAKRVREVAKRIARRDARLADQLSRAASAVPAMIAEGSGLGTDRAYANSVSEAIGEISEVESHTQQGFDDGLLSELEHKWMTEGSISIRRKLIGLRRTLRGQPRQSDDANPNPNPNPNPSPEPEP
jgi:four helix bundle protein